MSQPPSGPTPERLRHAGKLKDGDFEIGGNKRDGHRYKMTDSPLAKALVRQKISGEEYSALKRYALHWLAGGLAGHLNSLDLNRILAFDPTSMSGLAKNEAQADHRNLYRQARACIGHAHPEISFVADQVACLETDLMDTGHLLGYHSPYRARVAALELLRDAGDRLADFWEHCRNQ
jgi:hypothetical protein